MNAGDREPNTRRYRFDFRFTIGTMLLVMLIGSFIAAAAGYLWQAMRTNTSWLVLFFPFVLIAPMGLMILVSVIRRILMWISRK